MSANKIKARLRTEAAATLPRLLRLYAQDALAAKLIQHEIYHRQQMTDIKAKIKPITR